MAVKTNTVEIMTCDICGKESQPMKSSASMPEGFSSVLVGGFMNVCDDCRALLIKGVDELKGQRRAG
jgi:ribosome-binding protein aMBF1 (putative translation factor)